MRLIKIVFIVISILVLTSCARLYGDNSYIADRDNAYLKAKTLPPLKIPSGLDSSTIRSDYPITDRPYSSSAENVSLTPPELYPEK
jgi:uncharacterized lipoprotein